MKTEPKSFDCVDLMHEGALRIYEATKNMSIEEELAYWRDKTRQGPGQMNDKPVTLGTA